MITNFTIDDISLNEKADNRIDAIKRAGEILVRNNKIKESYIDEMISVLDEFGPYFVLTPGIAFAHSKPSSSVLETGLSIITLENSVEFGSEQNDPVKMVCAIASIDSSDHLLLLQKLVVLLSDEANKEFIFKASTEEEAHKIIEMLNNASA